MSFAFPLTGLATIAALLVFLGTGLRVGAARRQFGIKAPATTGDPDFERVFRVQMNTLEQLVLFLPALWLAAVAFADLWAAVPGAVWVVGRVVYALTTGMRRPVDRALLTVFPTFILLMLATFSILRGFAA